jgi:hypothetical protein
LEILKARRKLEETKGDAVVCTAFIEEESDTSEIEYPRKKILLPKIIRVCTRMLTIYARQRVLRTSSGGVWHRWVQNGYFGER